MKRCSYSWEDWGKLMEEVEKQCPEEIWSGSEEHCIFHDPSLEKDTELFEQKLEEKLAKEDFNFRGYFFPKDIGLEGFEFKQSADFRAANFKNAHFSGTTFQKDVNFSGATFQGYVYFSEATFQGHAVFLGATFQGHAVFLGATFQGHAVFNRSTFQNAYFSGATFQWNADFRKATFRRDAVFNRSTFQNAYFSGATFRDTDFSGATIEKNIEFEPEHIEKLNLRHTQFFFRGSITANLKKARFHRAYLGNLAFIDCEWPEKIYEEEHMEDERLTFKELETIYRDLKQNMQRHGNYSQAGNFYYREMECRKRAMKEKKISLNWFKSFGYPLLKYTCGYGEKPERTAFSSAITIVLFAFFYWGLNCLEYPRGNPEFLHGFFHAVYFSFVTFTTLGLGDIHPSNNLGMALICCEAVIGAFLIALFVVVFARKMMR